MAFNNTPAMGYETEDSLKDNELDWNDSIFDDGNSDELVVLPEGDYNFKVVKFERGRSKGSAKIPPCNMATITLKFEGKEGSSLVSHYLILHRSMEWKLSEFFRGIGMKKHGEKLVMDWNNIVGKSGRAKLKVETYEARDGEKKEKNSVDKIYDYDPKNFAEGPSLDIKSDDLPF